MLYIDHERDIALVSTEEAVIGYKKNKGTVVRVFGKSKYVSPGNVSYAIGYPAGIGPMVTDGIVSKTNYSVDDWDGSYRLLMSTSDISPGSSGGALFVLRNGFPTYVGMTRYTFQELDGVYGFIMIKDIKKSFFDNGFEWLTD